MNTKRVIQYFATISVGGEKKKQDQSKVSVLSCMTEMIQASDKKDMYPNKFMKLLLL